MKKKIALNIRKKQIPLLGMTIVLVFAITWVGTGLVKKYLQSKIVNTIGLSRIKPVNGSLNLSRISYMQEMTPEICEQSQIGSEAELTDYRDNNKYLVRRAKDGNCWMTQNLGLDISLFPELKPEDSDVNAVVNLKTLENNIPENPEKIISDNEDYNLMPKAQEGKNLVFIPEPQSLSAPYSKTNGFLYNYSAAVAGAFFTNPRDYAEDGTKFPLVKYRMPVNGGFKKSKRPEAKLKKLVTFMVAPKTTRKMPIAKTSICPKGWTLPAGRMEEGGMRNLLKAENDGAERSFVKNDSVLRMKTLTGTYENSISTPFVPYNNTAGYGRGEAAYWSDFMSGKAEKILAHNMHYQIYSALALSTKEEWREKRSDGDDDAAMEFRDTSDYAAIRCVAKNELTDWRKTLNDRNLKTDIKPSSDILTMQEVTPEVCKKMNAERVYYFADRRDGRVYPVAKMKDGNCWMASDLRLELATQMVNVYERGYKRSKLTEEDSSVEKEWEANGLVEDGDDGIDTLRIIYRDDLWKRPELALAKTILLEKNTDIINGRDLDGGVFYNYNAAIANPKIPKIIKLTQDKGRYYIPDRIIRQLDQEGKHWLDFYPDTDPQTSICPKNWELPAANKTNRPSFTELLSAHSLSKEWAETKFGVRFLGAHREKRWSSNSRLLDMNSLGELVGYEKEQYFWTSELNDKKPVKYKIELADSDLKAEAISEDPDDLGLQVRCVVRGK